MTGLPYSFQAHEPPIKLAKKLLLKKEAEALNLCLVEGWKCFNEAQVKGEPIALFLLEGINPPSTFKSAAPCFTLSEKQFKTLSSTQTPEGVVAIFHRPLIKNSFPAAKANELHLILYEWRDPNNLGAVVRSARGLGLKSITLWGTGPDFFSAKVIRTSMGSVFHLDLHHVGLAQTLAPESQLFLADASGTPLESLRLDPSIPAFILIGSESHGWPKNLQTQGVTFSIPLKNQLESLSAPIAASLSAYAFMQKLSKQTSFA